MKTSRTVGIILVLLGVISVILYDPVMVNIVSHYLTRAFVVAALLAVFIAMQKETLLDILPLIIGIITIVFGLLFWITFDGIFSLFCDFGLLQRALFIFPMYCVSFEAIIIAIGGLLIVLGRGEK